MLHFRHTAIWTFCGTVSFNRLYMRMCLTTTTAQLPWALPLSPIKHRQTGGGVGSKWNRNYCNLDVAVNWKKLFVSIIYTHDPVYLHSINRSCTYYYSSLQHSDGEWKICLLPPPPHFGCCGRAVVFSPVSMWKLYSICIQRKFCLYLICHALHKPNLRPTTTTNRDGT